MRPKVRVISCGVGYFPNFTKLTMRCLVKKVPPDFGKRRCYAETPCLRDIVKEIRTPLHLAVIEQQTQTVSDLITSKNALDVDAKDFDKKTALYYAVQSRNLQIIKLLLDAGAKVFKNSLNEAVKSLNFDLLTLFLDKISVEDYDDEKKDEDKEKDEDDEDDVIVIEDEDEDEDHGVTFLREILRDEDDDDDDEDEDEDEDDDDEDEDEDDDDEDEDDDDEDEDEEKDDDDDDEDKCSLRTLFELAFQFGNSNMIKLILSSKAAAKLKNKDKEYFLHQSIKMKNPKIVKELLDFGVNVDAVDEKYGNTPLHLAVDPKNFDTLRLLLDYKANVNVKNNENLTPLHLAIKVSIVVGAVDCTDTIILLLEAGSEVNSVDEKNGYTPLHTAVVSKNEKIVKLLLDAGAEIEALNDYKDTPLHWAASFKNTNILRLLLMNSGSVINTKNGDKRTPLYSAILASNYSASKMLLEAGADVNLAEDYSGFTPLHVACEKRKLDLVKLLLEYGADLNSWTKDKKTPFMLFVKRSKEMNEKKRSEGFKLLLKYYDVNFVEETGKNVLSGILESDRYVEEWNLFYKYILEHVAKVKVSNQQVDSSLLDTISRISKHSDYFNKCIKELEKAKSTKLHNCRISFLNLLVDDKSKFIKYAGNYDLVKDSKNSVKKFPIYGWKMESNMTYGIEGRKLFDEAADVLSYYLPMLSPTHLVIRDTLDALSVEDWKKLCVKKRVREE